MEHRAPAVRIGRRPVVIVLVALLAAAVLVPVTAMAAGGTFTDDDTSIFEADIEWLAGAGVTKGCNPPANTRFCPDESVTRGQMAAFMRRFAAFLGAEDGIVSRADHAATAGSADAADHAATAGNADKVDGFHASDLMRHGEIVMAHDGSAWTRYGTANITVRNYGAYTYTVGFGYVVLPLDAPTLIGGRPYELSEVEVCYNTTGGAEITGVKVLASIGTNWSGIYEDFEKRTGKECEIIPVAETAPRGASLVLTLTDPGGGDGVYLFSARTTWTESGGLVIASSGTSGR